MADTDSPRVMLPGFGLHRLSGWQMGGCRMGDARFPHALEGRGKLSFGVYLRELRMLGFIGLITDKPEWQWKVFDETIVSKWRQETKDAPALDDGDVYMSDAMFDFCIAELCDKAKRSQTTGFVNTLDAELTVVKSDTAVSDDLENALRRCVAALENIPDRDKDWHPGSDEKVLDLLHPSLFPVVFGRTKALQSGNVPLHDCVAFTGKGDLTQDTPMDRSNCYQDLYQWLPSDVVLTEAGASITSYINNLHPKHHKDLYSVLETFVRVSVPLWEECLSRWEDRRRFVAYTDDDDDYYLPEGLAYQIPVVDDDDNDSTVSADPDDYLYTDEYIDWKEQHRILKFPEPKEFVPFDEQVDHSKRVDLRAQYPKGLQIIFKLANIHLTPERPKYDGGTWHIEGTLSERICASALYYYDEKNITTSHLSFRRAVDEQEVTMIPAQNNYHSLESYMGVEQDGVAVQDLGSVETRRGRLLAFPNVLQHRVSSFELDDETKPGYRKILAMFLVDPNRRVLSTANVPPQRKDWWSVLVREIPVFRRLPFEVFTHIINMVDTFPMSWDEAVEVRADLMERRSAFTEKQDSAINEYTFSFCEH